MGSQESLKAAMREALDADGVISHIKAELRAAIFQNLSDVSPGTEDATGSGVAGDHSAHPLIPPENMVINELIKEYLEFNGLEHSLAVFQLEAKVPDTRVPRQVLATELNLAGAPSSVPFLYAMLHEARLSRDVQ